MPRKTRSDPQAINFDRKVIFPSKTASGDKGPSYEDLGLRRGSCTLLCHGKDHDDEDYGD